MAAALRRRTRRPRRARGERRARAAARTCSRRAVDVADAKALLDVLDRLKGRLPGAAILLGTAADGRVHLVASVAPELVERGVKAGAVVKRAAELVGGGGGGRDTLAQAGGRDPERLGRRASTRARCAIEVGASPGVSACACSRSTTAARAAAAR